MANPEHVAKLYEGIDALKKWRLRNRHVRPDLSGAKLSGAYLSRAFLTEADFSKADLMGAYLDGADLSKADVRSANLSRAHLNWADINQCRLDGADLRWTRLKGAKLENSKLFGADLSGADLRFAKCRRADLGGVKLSYADLGEADFRDAKLQRADFSGENPSPSGGCMHRGQPWHADLGGANFVRANLSEANLSGVRLIKADLSEADLSWADLSGAELDGANLSRANLSGANLGQASLGQTVIADVDLSTVKNLDSVIHHGPSTIGIDTLYKSQGKIPETFLRGCGVPEQFITYARSLVANPIEFYSSFISYSSKDQEFTERLHSDLRAKNLRVWFAPEDLKIGDRFQDRIEESIRVYDKVMIVLSEASVKSRWVEREVNAAREREDGENRTVLFPIRIDAAVMDATMPWAADIRRTRHIGDFSRWKDHDSYQKALERLLRDLKAEASDGASPKRV